MRPFSGHFRSRKSILNIRKKSIFFHENLDFCDFLDFLNFDDAIDNPAGFGRKNIIFPKMCSRDPQDTSSYLVCYHMSNRKNLQLSEKKHIFEFMMKILNIKDFHHKFKNMFFFQKAVKLFLLDI